MTAFTNCSSLLQGTIALLFFLDALFALYTVLRAVIHQNSVKSILLSSMGFCFCLAIYLLLEWMISFLVRGIPFTGIQVPWIFLVVLVLLLGSLSLAIVLQTRRYQRPHISSNSIKEAIDELPAGICCYYESGRICLANPLMDELSRELTGLSLQNGNLFRHMLESGLVRRGCTVVTDGTNPIIISRRGLVYSFSHHSIKTDEGTLGELIAVDITEEYKKALLLQEKNQELERINLRLRQYGQTVAQVAREGEILNAKVSIHDRMNYLLLSTRHAMGQSPEAQSIQKVLELWRGNVLLLCQDRSSQSEQDLASQLLLAAGRSIGIQVHISGQLPTDTTCGRVILQAATECLSNAVRHCEAKNLSIQCLENSIEITNDGSAPTGPIREGGGLSFVRRSAEAAGAKLSIEWSPVFLLRLRFPSPFQIKGENTTQ